jgi:hypothetical protein
MHVEDTPQGKDTIQWRIWSSGIRTHGNWATPEARPMRNNLNNHRSQNNMVLLNVVCASSKKNHMLLAIEHLFRVLLESQLVLGLIGRSVQAVIAAVALRAQQIRRKTSAVASCKQYARQ